MPHLTEPLMVQSYVMQIISSVIGTPEASIRLGTILNTIADNDQITRIVEIIEDRSNIVTLRVATDKEGQLGSPRSWFIQEIVENSWSIERLISRIIRIKRESGSVPVPEDSSAEDLLLLQRIADNEHGMRLAWMLKPDVVIGDFQQTLVALIKDITKG